MTINDFALLLEALIFVLIVSDYIIITGLHEYFKPLQELKMPDQKVLVTKAFYETAVFAGTFGFMLPVLLRTAGSTWGMIEYFKMLKSFACMKVSVGVYILNLVIISVIVAYNLYFNRYILKFKIVRTLEKIELYSELITEAEKRITEMSGSVRKADFRHPFATMLENYRIEKKKCEDRLSSLQFKLHKCIYGAK